MRERRNRITKSQAVFENERQFFGVFRPNGKLSPPVQIAWRRNYGVFLGQCAGVIFPIRPRHGSSMEFSMT